MDVGKPSRRVQALSGRTYQQDAYLKFNDEGRFGVLYGEYCEKRIEVVGRRSKLCPIAKN